MLLNRLQLAVAGIVIAVLLVVALVQTVRIDGFLWIDGLSDKLDKCQKRERKAKEDADKQKQTTSENIAKTRDRIVKVEVPAKRVENAPLPGNCQTPREILEADL